MRRDPAPPRTITMAVFLALATLLFYPIHAPYLHPDQDLLPTLPLIQLARGTWRPLVRLYPSALPNLLHVADLVLLRLGRVVGWWKDPADLLLAWCDAPWLFRIPPRIVAMTAGVASLLAARGLMVLAAGRASALIAPAFLGTSLMFVREHHHGLYDAPAAGLAMLALWAACTHVRLPRLRYIVAAGALAGLATSCKLNLGPVGFGVLAGALVAPREHRVRNALCAGLAGLAALLVTTPELAFDPWETVSSYAAFLPLQAQALAAAAGNDGNQFLGALLRGIGWPGLISAAAGCGVALATRERALVPLLAFVTLYGLGLVRAPLVLSRYALPLAGPIAVLAAYGISRLPAAARALAVAIIIAVGLPSSVAYVRLLAIEDTRVEAASLVRREWAQGAHVLMAANPVLASYVGPDLPQLPRFSPGLPADVAMRVAAEAPRCVTPLETIDVVRTGAALLRESGGVIVTSDPPASVFDRASTPPEAIAVLEHQATLVADLRVGEHDVAPTYEPFDLNYLPFTRLGSITRPGPRLRIWRVVTAPGAPDAPSAPSSLHPTTSRSPSPDP